MNLTERLQQKCSDWGVYWRAPDAHGVVLTHEQALELLRDALGVEVEFAAGADRTAFVRDAKLAIVGAAAKLIDEFSAAIDAGGVVGTLPEQQT